MLRIVYASLGHFMSNEVSNYKITVADGSLTLPLSILKYWDPRLVFKSRCGPGATTSSISIQLYSKSPADDRALTVPSGWVTVLMVDIKILESRERRPRVHESRTVRWNAHSPGSRPFRQSAVIRTQCGPSGKCNLDWPDR